MFSTKVLDYIIAIRMDDQNLIYFIVFLEFSSHELSDYRFMYLWRELGVSYLLICLTRLLPIPPGIFFNAINLSSEQSIIRFFTDFGFDPTL